MGQLGGDGKDGELQCLRQFVQRAGTQRGNLISGIEPLTFRAVKAMQANWVGDVVLNVMGTLFGCQFGANQLPWKFEHFKDLVPQWIMCPIHF